MKSRKMKKLVGVVLAMVLAGSLLAGCGSTTGGETGQDVGTSAGNEQTVEIAAQTFTVTTTYSENEFAGQAIQELDKQLQELSGGKLALDVYYGGTMAGTGEELTFVGEGGVDMTLIGQSQYANVLSLLNFPSQVLTGYADSVKLMDDIAFNNEATKDAVQAEIEANNVVMLGSLPGGSNSFITKKEYTTLADMKGIKLGVGMNQTAMEQ